ncbi:hypothetical protein LINGRAPRIM_LOCUS2561 [Linum grandiflorum]
MGHSKVIIETDCQQVSNPMVGDVVDVTEFGRLVVECKAKLLSKPDFTVVFCRRDGNGVAHALARRAITSNVTVLGEVPPVWLSADLANTCFSDSH